MMLSIVHTFNKSQVKRRHTNADFMLFVHPIESKSENRECLHYSLQYTTLFSHSSHILHDDYRLLIMFVIKVFHDLFFYDNFMFWCSPNLALISHKKKTNQTKPIKNIEAPKNDIFLL